MREMCFKRFKVKGKEEVFVPPRAHVDWQTRDGGRFRREKMDGNCQAVTMIESSFGYKTPGVRTL
jgi:hypothetical protein